MPVYASPYLPLSSAVEDLSPPFGFGIPHSSAGVGHGRRDSDVHTHIAGWNFIAELRAATPLVVKIDAAFPYGFSEMSAMASSRFAIGSTVSTGQEISVFASG